MAQNNVHYGYIEGNARRQSTNDFIFSVAPTLDEMGSTRPMPGLSPLARFMAQQNATARRGQQ